MKSNYPDDLTFLFLIDGMHGSLARKLRILGFDTTYERDLEDNELVQRAKKERRILITSDLQLKVRARRSGIECVFVQGSTDEQRLIELFSKIGFAARISCLSPRCSMCNGALADTIDKTEYGVPISQCSECGKRYWRGSHWKKLDDLFQGVDRSFMTK